MNRTDFASRVFVTILLVIIVLVTILKINHLARHGSIPGNVLETIDERRQWRRSIISSALLPGVDNLAWSPGGVLYATLELKMYGSLVRIAPGGKTVTVLGGLDRPDGLLRFGHMFYITEEVIPGRVLSWNSKTRKLRELAKARNPEGISRFADGRIVFSEDIPGGNIIVVGKNRKPKIYYANMNRPEGICVTRDQALIVAETGAGRVVKIRRGRLTVLVSNLDAPDQVECRPDGSIWISEDASPGRVFRLKNRRLYLVANNLFSPQGIAFGKGGEIYIAEQRLSRIVRFDRINKAGLEKRGHTRPGN